MFESHQCVILGAVVDLICLSLSGLESQNVNVTGFEFRTFCDHIFENEISVKRRAKITAWKLTQDQNSKPHKPH